MFFLVDIQILSQECHLNEPEPIRKLKLDLDNSTPALYLFTEGKPYQKKNKPGLFFNNSSNSNESYS
jgi:hypothetical protein